MIVQTYFPQRLSPARYDSYLASGWFRGSVMLYKMDLLCLEEDVFSVVNIRLNLNNFSPKKRHRKLLRKNDARFETIIRPAQPNEEKEALYQIHKSKFKGFIHHTLNDYLHSGHLNSVFNTYEVCVYDGTRLVAVSFFDIGGTALASLLGLYDPDYAEFSLGIYTMLKEAEQAKTDQLKWYYPGYILDKPSSFNYKLSLGEVEYYNAKKRWSRFKNFNTKEFSAWKYKYNMARMEDALRHHGIEFKSWLYPFFSMGYMGYWAVPFLKHPVFLEIPFGDSHKPEIICSYDTVRDSFVVQHIKGARSHTHLINMELSEEYLNEDKYLMNLMRVQEIILDTPDVSKVCSTIQALCNGVEY